MNRLTWPRLGALTAGAALLSWIINWALERRGSTPPPMPWTIPVVLIAASAGVLWLGWQVRQFREGKRPGLDPIQAARTAMFAQAAGYAGAVLAGAYGGYVLALLGDWGHVPRRNLILAGLLAALASVGLAVAGWIAERWCVSDDGDGAPPGPEPEAA